MKWTKMLIDNKKTDKRLVARDNATPSPFARVFYAEIQKKNVKNKIKSAFDRYLEF